MTDLNLTDDQRAAAEKAAKLLKLAGRNPNENEAASATAKAMKILLDANLTVAQAERAGEVAADGRRDETKWSAALLKEVQEREFLTNLASDAGGVDE